MQTLSQSVSEDSFVRFTLSKNRDKQSDLKKVLIKLVLIRRQPHLCFIYRHRTKDITKNYPVEKGLAEADRLMREVFLIYNLFTTQADCSAEQSGNGQLRIKKKPPSFAAPPSRQHDKQKTRRIHKPAWLHHLGITGAQGQILKDKGGKYRQINKFVEIIDGLLKKEVMTWDRSVGLKVADMGCGKGYLTFALYDYLHHQLGLNAQIVGVELRPDLVKASNRIARTVGFQHLTFETGFIGNYPLSQTDMLIALHACDTATDDAISKGIQVGAKWIICAPCCHKQIRKQIKDEGKLNSILQHGILKERQAEIITDAIRALLLKAHGYKTTVFEFISTEHTGKNVMIVGQRHDHMVDSTMYFREIEQLKAAFGIDHHYLETLLIC